MPILALFALGSAATYVGGLMRSSVDTRRGGRQAERIGSAADSGRRPPGAMLDRPGVGNYGASAARTLSGSPTWATRADAAGGDIWETY